MKFKYRQIFGQPTTAHLPPQTFQSQVYAADVRVQQQQQQQQQQCQLALPAPITARRPQTQQQSTFTALPTAQPTPQTQRSILADVQTPGATASVTNTAR